MSTKENHEYFLFMVHSFMIVIISLMTNDDTEGRIVNEHEVLAE